jgi:2-oxoglutarate dehydrogenase complex dehydrogenase (E1) component-like enzyme
LKEFELEHWQLSDKDSTSQYPMDYRVTSVTKDLTTIQDIQNHLKKTYAENITAEFEHVKDEEERIWLYDNYEQFMTGSEVKAEEKIKAL